MDEYLLKDFTKIIKKNAQEMRHNAIPAGTDVMRIYNLNLEALPLTVDLYGAYVRIEDWGSAPLSETDKAEVSDAVHRFVYTDSDKIVYVYRAKLSRHEQHSARGFDDVSSGTSCNGSENISDGETDDFARKGLPSESSESFEGQNSFKPQNAFEVRNAAEETCSAGDVHSSGDLRPTEGSRTCTLSVMENNLFFKVNLSAYTDTGLFLDQVNRRLFIKEQSEGRRVLNLFSYTGSFSVYAASGGAESVTSVDLSNTYTAWAAENLKRNGYEGKGYACIAEDAKSFVKKEIEKHSRYDIIIFDPPVFSNSHKMDYTFNVQRDYKAWVTMLYSLLPADGFILFSTNLSTFEMDRRAPKGLKITDITDETRAPGFTKKGIQSKCFLMVKDGEVKNFEWGESVKKNGESARKGKSFAEKKGGLRYGRDYKGVRGFRDRENRDFNDFNDYDMERRTSGRKADSNRGSGNKENDGFKGYRGSGRKEYRSFRDDRTSGERGFGEKERRSFGDERGFGDVSGKHNNERVFKDRRNFSGERSFRRERGENNFERNNYGERGENDFERNNYGERGFKGVDRRNFDRGREAGGRKTDSERGSGNKETRGFKSDRGAESMERRGFKDDREFKGVDRLDFDRDREACGRKADGRGRFEDGNASKMPRTKSKPYGYGTFRSARNRSDSDEYFDFPVNEKD